MKTLAVQLSHTNGNVNVEMQSNQARDGLVKQDVIGPHDVAATIAQTP